MITQKSRAVQYLASAHGRHLRFEAYGDVTNTEKLFIRGISHFAASTMSRHDDAYTRFVSGIMFRLVRYLALKK